jgi:hypothetical protein
MKPKLIPLYLPNRDEDFAKQLNALKDMLAEEAEFLEPIALGDPLPKEAEAVIFPQMLGDAYRMVDEFKKIDIPILVVTSEFGTVLMWDWEIVSFLRSKGVDTIAPYSLDQTKKLCRALKAKQDLRGGKFLVFQDNPGEGFQAEIFKRFYWWEDECSRLMKQKFGLTIEKRSFKELGAKAKEISDAEAEAAAKEWDFPILELSKKQVNSALKIYLAVKREVEADPSIRAAGINCLNESHYSDTTPCLAWNFLFMEKDLIWGCEADTTVMLTKYLIYKALDVEIMMTNIYPFLMGMAALKHENIPSFPEIVEEPENHILLAHCGYLGVVPQCFAADWVVRDKVLAIVDDNAHALDARLRTGPATMAKLGPSMKDIQVVEGDLKGYVQYAGSDCRNGAIMKVPNGHKMVNETYSHHQLLMTGHQAKDIELISKIYGLEVHRM